MAPTPTIAAGSILMPPRRQPRHHHRRPRHHGRLPHLLASRMALCSCVALSVALMLALVSPVALASRATPSPRALQTTPDDDTAPTPTTRAPWTTSPPTAPVPGTFAPVTAAPAPAPTEKESTFLGFFKTEKLYLALSLGVPVVFFFYKFGLFWFFARHKRPGDHDHDDDDRDTASTGGLTASTGGLTAMGAPPLAGIDHAHASTNGKSNIADSRSTDATYASSVDRSNRASKPVAGTNQGGRASQFWVDEELQAWRLDFQQLKLTKAVSSTLEQRQRESRRIAAHAEMLASPMAGPAASEVWLATYFAGNNTTNTSNGQGTGPPPRSVALKWISPQLPQTEAQQEKLKQEIKRQAKLSHPNIVAFIGIAWSPETNLVAVTEFMAGGDLRQWLQRKAAKDAGRWSTTKLQMLLDVANALVYLHSFQPRLIHGNVNSRNVLLSDKMQAKLSDFGAPVDHLTEREIMAYKKVGSGRWISPEALMGRQQGGGSEAMSDAMDVYSLGILMVEMDTHALPFADLMTQNKSQLPETDVLQLISNGALTPTLSPTCHPRVEQLVRACTVFDPQKRPSSRSIANLLQRTLEEQQQAMGRGSSLAGLNPKLPPSMGQQQYQQQPPQQQPYQQQQQQYPQQQEQQQQYQYQQQQQDQPQQPVGGNRFSRRSAAPTNDSVFSMGSNSVVSIGADSYGGGSVDYGGSADYRGQSSIDFRDESMIDLRESRDSYA